MSLNLSKEIGNPMSKSLEGDDLLYTLMKKIVDEIGAKQNETQAQCALIRVHKRLSDLKITNGQDYLKYYRENEIQEHGILVSLLTTHHTYFFREMEHFNFVKENINAFVDRMKQTGQKKLTIWSAACSKGHEAYSIAIHLEELKKEKGLNFDYEIHCSDIDGHSVNIGKNAVYHWNDVKHIPSHLIANYLVRGQGDISEFYKVKKDLVSKCSFKPGNLNEPATYPATDFDLIFCRNVFIYFDMNSIKKITNQLVKKLKPNGFLITGVSESLPYKELELYHSGNSIYSKLPPPVEKKQDKVVEAPIRVICVDDSPTILKLLQSILTKQEGFEIVGTAMNGLEAQELLKKTPCDVMTLDIHMPKMNGIEYLQASMNNNHPPVLIMSSVSRDDLEFAKKAKSLGAKDYIEKPTIQNIKTISDEIRFKLRSYKSSKQMFVHESKVKPLPLANYSCYVLFDDSSANESSVLKTQLESIKNQVKFVHMKDKAVMMADFDKSTDKKILCVIAKSFPAMISQLKTKPHVHILMDEAIQASMNKTDLLYLQTVIPFTSLAYEMIKKLKVRQEEELKLKSA